MEEKRLREVRKLQAELRTEKESREKGSREEKERIVELQRTVRKLKARIELEEKEGESEEITTISLSEESKTLLRGEKQKKGNERGDNRRTRLEMKRRMNYFEQALTASETSVKEKDIQIQSMSDTISVISRELTLCRR